jgi:hypothetical protein
MVKAIGNGLWFERPQFQLLDGSVVPKVARAQGEIIVGSRGCYDGIAGPKPVRQRIFLNINGCSVADVLAQGKNPKAVFTQEVQDMFMLSLLPRPLEQLHIGQHGNTTLFFSFDQGCSPMVSLLYPNENVGVK